MSDSAPRASRATLAEVARVAGVSIGAVSQVLNENPNSRISSSARERIAAAVTELGYRPNIVARSLRMSSTSTYGFVSDAVTITRFATGILRGALRASASRDHMLLIAETEGDPDAERRAVDSLLDRQVDGIIFAAMKSRTPEALGLPPGLPHVFVNMFGSAPAVSVLPDEFEGGRSAIEALVDAGHRDRIALVGARTEPEEQEGISPTARRRLAGIANAMADESLAFLRAAGFDEWEPEGGYIAARRMLAESHPSAFVCMNDRIAFGVYQAIAEAGLRVPADVSVVSFDDDELATSMRPGLTTVAIPHEQMGALAVDAITSRADGTAEVLVPMPLQERGSIGGPAPLSP